MVSGITRRQRGLRVRARPVRARTRSSACTRRVSKTIAGARSSWTRRRSGSSTPSPVSLARFEENAGTTNTSPRPAGDARACSASSARPRPSGSPPRSSWPRKNDEGRRRSRKSGAAGQAEEVQDRQARRQAAEHAGGRVALVSRAKHEPRRTRTLSRSCRAHTLRYAGVLPAPSPTASRTVIRAPAPDTGGARAFAVTSTACFKIPGTGTS